MPETLRLRLGLRARNHANETFLIALEIHNDPARLLQAQKASLFVTNGMGTIQVLSDVCRIMARMAADSSR